MCMLRVLCCCYCYAYDARTCTVHAACCSCSGEYVRIRDQSSEYVRIRAQHVGGRGSQRSVPVRHVFARIFARIPRIWGHVFRDPDPRIFRVLTV